MFIHYNVNDLFAFFENSSILLGGAEAGELIYIYECNNFKLILYVSVYGKTVEIHISFREKTVMRQKFKNVAKIERVNADLKIYTDDHVIRLTKEPQIGAVIDEG